MMNNNTVPLISVIIPCYNVELFVEQAILSILNQTFKNLEIWIVDDASTDNTLQIVKNIKDERIKLLELKKNTQKVGAVNEVLKKVTGNYIAFQDSDDWSEPQRLEKQLEAFEKNPSLGICFTNYRKISDKIYPSGRIAFTNEELRNEFLNFKALKENASPTACSSMMISRAALEKTSGYSPFFAGRVAEDIQWIYRILKYFNGVTIQDPLYNYRIRPGSFSQISTSGIKPKYVYSWHLLEKIIYKDIHEGVDMLSPDNLDELKKLELEACEEALTDYVVKLNKMKESYASSTSFRLGNYILAPLRALKKLF